MCSIFGDVMRGTPQHDIGSSLEPFFRRVVRFLYAFEVDTYISVFKNNVLNSHS